MEYISSFHFPPFLHFHTPTKSVSISTLSIPLKLNYILDHVFPKSYWNRSRHNLLVRSLFSSFSFIDLDSFPRCVGVWQNDRVEIIANDQGNRTTPSYVSFSDNERLIGDAAKNQVAMNPHNTYVFFCSLFFVFCSLYSSFFSF